MGLDSIDHDLSTSQMKSYQVSEQDQKSLASADLCSPLFQGDPQLLMKQEITKTFAYTTQGHDSFFVVDLSLVYKQHLRWIKYLPSVQPFYAVKCNPDLFILQLLAELGAGFDCASLAEMENTLKALSKYSSGGEKIIFANPCKFSADLSFAAQHGISMSTFDNFDELDKIAQFHAKSHLLLRILTDDSGSRFPLGQKYGAPLHIVPALLSRAHALHLNVIGVAFHVGSSCYNAEVYRDAIYHSRQVFDIGRSVGYVFTMLDIGGGFDDSPIKPGSEVSPFEEVAQVVNKALSDYFPASAFPKKFQVIAEPGRFHVYPALTYATCIIARRTPWNQAIVQNMLHLKSEDFTSNKAEKDLIMYYLSDGIYGGLANVIADRRAATPYVISMGGSFDIPQDNTSELVPSRLWGPTCDSVDLVSPRVMLTPHLNVGDWLAFPNMGAYSICLGTKFNGYEAGRVLHATGSGKEGEIVYSMLQASAKRAAKL